LTPPAPPTGLSASHGNTVVFLDWDDNIEADFDGYSVYRSTTTGGPYSLVNGTVVNVSQFTDSGLTNDVTYYYVVTASDLLANESTESSEINETPVFSASGGGTIVWINEFHYDNNGGDSGEFFEIAGPAGLSLAGWSVIGYNGNGGVTYDTVNLSGSLPDQENGYGTLSFNMLGMQNGGPDALALVNAESAIVEFIKIGRAHV